MKKFMKVIVMVAILAMLAVACGPKAAAPVEEPPAAEEAAMEPEAPAAEPAVMNELDKIKEAGKIVVGTSADYEPWEYKDENDNFVGLDMDIMREIGKRMGVEVEFQDLGFDALVTAVQEGKVDAAIASMTATEERKEQVDFSIVYYTGPNVILKAAGSTITFTDPLEAAKYKLGTQSGTIMQYWIEDNLITPGLMTAENMSLYERNEQVALELKAGRIDLGIMDLEPGKQFMADPAFDFEEAWRGEMNPEGNGIAIMKGSDALKAELDKHITDMLKEGVIAKLMTQYGVE